MNIQNDSSLGEIVTNNFHTAEIFEDLGLDFCCGGKITILNACKDKGLDTDNVISRLNHASNSHSNDLHYNEWDINFLINYIVINHHSYITRSISTIEHHLENLKRKLGIQSKSELIESAQAYFHTNYVRKL